MKKLLFILGILISVSAFGQSTPKSSPTFSNPNYYPQATKSVQTGQMLNIANAYTGTSVIDTVTGSTGTIYLYTAISGTPTVAVDTFLPYPIFGYSTISFLVVATKISGTPDASVTLQESYDGVLWGEVRLAHNLTPASSLAASVTTTYTNNTPETFTMANSAGAQGFTWDEPIKFATYYRLAIKTSTVTQSSTVKAQYMASQPVKVN